MRQLSTHSCVLEGEGAGFHLTLHPLTIHPTDFYDTLAMTSPGADPENTEVNHLTHCPR